MTSCGSLTAFMPFVCAATAMRNMFLTVAVGRGPSFGNMYVPVHRTSARVGALWAGTVVTPHDLRLPEAARQRSEGSFDLPPPFPRDSRACSRRHGVRLLAHYVSVPVAPALAAACSSSLLRVVSAAPVVGYRAACRLCVLAAAVFSRARGLGTPRTRPSSGRRVAMCSCVSRHRTTTPTGSSGNGNGASIVSFRRCTHMLCVQATSYDSAHNEGTTREHRVLTWTTGRDARCPRVLRTHGSLTAGFHTHHPCSSPS